MRKKSKEKQLPDNLLPVVVPFVPKEADMEFFNDKTNFIDDAPRHWVANTKSKLDKDGLSVKQHLLIYHVAIMAGWFKDDLYPTLKEKCIQYHLERNLASIGVTTESFYKSYSSVEYSYLKVPKNKRKRPKKTSKYSTEVKRPKYTIIKKKYIELELIESVFPFILKWYPTAAFFVQTLNTDPYRLNEKHFYWIYRRIKDVSTAKIKLKHFFEKNCPNLNFNSFSSHDYLKSSNAIPRDIKSYINPYLRMHYPEVLKEEKRKRREKQIYYRKKVTHFYLKLKNDYPQKFQLFLKKYFPQS